jgi:hypothetical protein
MYPRGILLPVEDLVDRLDRVLRVPGRQLSADPRRMIQSGVLSTGSDPRNPSFHFETDVHGIVFYESPSHFNGRVQDRDSRAEIPFVYLRTLVDVPAVVLRIALELLRGSLLNVLLCYELLDWTNVGFLHDIASKFIEPGAVAKTQSCVQSRVVASVTTTLEGLADRRVEVMTELMRQTLYAFNYRSDDLRDAVADVLRELGLV